LVDIRGEENSADAGTDSAEKEIKKPPHIRIFYFLAYMNLVLIFSIVFIMSPPAPSLKKEFAKKYHVSWS
jgi:hypothetical protein